MAQVCEICAKRRGVGNNVSHANNRTKRVWRPNLQRVRVRTERGVRRLRVCTRCIRSERIQKAV